MDSQRQQRKAQLRSLREAVVAFANARESVRLRLVALLSERGRLTNNEIRSISGYSRARVLRLMRSLRDEGLVEARGRGRGAHYVPGQLRIG